MNDEGMSRDYGYNYDIQTLKETNSEIYKFGDIVGCDGEDCDMSKDLFSRKKSEVNLHPIRDNLIMTKKAIDQPVECVVASRRTKTKKLFEGKSPYLFRHPN